MPKQNQRRDRTTLWSLYLLGVLCWLVVRFLRRPIAVADALLPFLLMMAPSSPWLLSSCVSMTDIMTGCCPLLHPLTLWPDLWPDRWRRVEYPCAFRGGRRRWPSSLPKWRHSAESMFVSRFCQFPETNIKKNWIVKANHKRNSFIELQYFYFTFFFLFLFIFFFFIFLFYGKKMQLFFRISIHSDIYCSGIRWS